MNASLAVRAYPALSNAGRYPPLFPDAVRPNGVHIIGAPGAGKSRLLGRGPVFDDFIRGIPQVVFDLPGGTHDNFIDKVDRIVPDYERRWWEQYHQPLPSEWVCYLESVQALFAQRIVYVDMSGKQAVMPFPLIYRSSAEESFYEIAQRPIEVFARMDPDQARAPVEGLNSIRKLGTNINMILAALDLQITEAPELIYHPEWWSDRFVEARAAYPEVAPALAAMKEFGNNKLEYRVRRSDSLLTKIDMFLKDPWLRAMFGAAHPGLDWQQVIDKKQTVLLDFRKVDSAEQLRFSLLWVFLYLLTFLKKRGYAGRQKPFGVVIDELSVLLGYQTSQQALMAEDIRLLLEVIGRNYGCWITLAHQNLAQIVDPAILNALMQMGTQCIGVVTNPDEAEYLARRLFQYDPHKVKKTENVWMKLDPLPILTFLGAPEFAMPRVIDKRTIEYTIDEQRVLSSYALLELRKFQFLTKMPMAEGDLTGTVELMDLSSLDPGQYPNEERLAETRRRLAERSGFSKDELLAEIERRTHTLRSKKQVKAPIEPAKLNTPKDDYVTPTISTSKSLFNGNDAADKQPVTAGRELARTRSGWEPIAEGKEG